LDHPNIVPIYEIGEDQGRHYFTMKFVEGGTLGERMAEFLLPGNERGNADGHGSKWKLQEQKSRIARLMIKVARAVHYAHQRGIIHRDLKPGNILQDREGEPFVADFGLAKALEENSDLTHTAGILGTPSYMSPEQAAGKKGPLTTASDIFSLGTLLYELLTGRTPFRGESAVSTLRNVMEEEPQHPSSINSSVDLDLATICLKCLEKDPGKRYESAQALSEDLERWLRQEPIQARAATCFERGMKWGRRRPATAAALMLSSITLLALLATGVALPALQEAKYQRTVAERAVEEAERQRDLAEKALNETEELRKSEAFQRQRAEEAFGKLEESLYARNIALTEREWQANNILQAERLLEECPTDLRGWEWDYLKRLCNSAILTIHFPSVVKFVTVSPDGKRIATVLSTGELKICDFSTGLEDPHVRIPPGNFTCAVFSPDSQHLAAGTSDGTVQFWDLSLREPLWVENEHSGKVTCIVFAPNGETFASGSYDQTVKIWDPMMGQAMETLKGHTEGINAIAFTPGGEKLVSGSGEPKEWVQRNTIIKEKPGELRVWNIRTGITENLYPLSSNIVLAVAILPDAKGIASYHGDGSIHRWDLSGDPSRPIRKHTPTPDVLKVSSNQSSFGSFNADGSTFVGPNQEQAAELWDTYEGPIGLIIRGQRGITTVAFSPTGPYLITGGLDKTVRVWRTDQDQRFQIPVIGRSFSDVEVSADGKYIATSSWIYSAADFSEITRFPQGFRRVSFSRTIGGRLVYHSQGLIFALEANEWQPERLTGLFPNFGYGAALSPDGRVIANGTYGRSGQGKLFDVQIAELLSKEITHVLGGHKFPIWDINFSPDGDLLAAATGSYHDEDWIGVPGEVVIWDWRKKRKLRVLQSHHYPIYGAKFSPDGRRIAAAGGLMTLAVNTPELGEIMVWDVDSGREIWSWRLSDRVVNVTFSPDGKRLVSGVGAGNSTPRNPVELKLFNLETGLQILSLPGPTATVNKAVFTPDGKRIIAASQDGKLLVYDTAPGKHVVIGSETPELVSQIGNEFPQ
jgi:eukaryotic-like serine/threonine-protein kinase